jgi:hypothetical protein
MPQGPFGQPKEEDDSIVSSFDLGGLAQIFLCHRHPAAGIANIAQLRHFWFTDMSWVGYRHTTVLAGVCLFDWLGVA